MCAKDQQDALSPSSKDNDTVSTSPCCSEFEEVPLFDEDPIIENPFVGGAAIPPDFISRMQSQETQPGAFAIPGIEPPFLRRQERVNMRVSSLSPSRPPSELLISAVAVDEEQPSLFVEASPISLQKGKWKWIVSLLFLLALLICSIVYGSFQASAQRPKRSDVESSSLTEDQNSGKAITHPSEAPTSNTFHSQAPSHKVPSPISTFPSLVPSIYTPQWEKVGEDIVSDQDSSSLGKYLALSSSGNVLAVGMHLYDFETNVNVGIVRIYELDSDEEWQQVGQDLVGTSTGEQFGCALDLSSDGSIVAVGSWTGVVSVYEYNRAFDFWYPLGSSVTMTDADASSKGINLSLSNDGLTLALGAPSVDANGTHSGCVLEVFRYSRLQDEWVSLALELYKNTSNSSTSSAVQVRLSGNGIVVALSWVEFDSENSWNVGQVRAYSLQANSTLTTLGASLSGFTGVDDIETSISISDDGMILAMACRSAIMIFHFDVEIQDWVKDEIDYKVLDESVPALSKNETIVNLSLEGRMLVMGRGSNASLAASIHTYILQNVTEFQWILLEEPSQTVDEGEMYAVPSVALSDVGIVAIGYPTFGNEDGKDLGKVQAFRLA